MSVKDVNFRGYKSPAARLKRRLRESNIKDFVAACRFVGMTDDQIIEQLEQIEKEKIKKESEK